MKLVAELHGYWIWHEGREGVGVAFDCPHCQACTLAVLFENPLCGGKPVPAGVPCFGQNNGKRWKREGRVLEHLSVRPSINASSTGHWHGHLIGGLCVGGV